MERVSIKIRDLNSRAQKEAVARGYSLDDRAKNFCMEFLGKLEDRDRINGLCDDYFGIDRAVAYQWRSRAGKSGGLAVRAKQLRSLEKEKNRLSKLLDKIDRKIKLEERDLEICRKWRDTFDEVIATGHSYRPTARTYISKLREKYGTTLVPYRSQK
jgi:hypothetical protein